MCHRCLRTTVTDVSGQRAMFVLEDASCAYMRKYLKRGVGGRWESSGGQVLLGNIKLEGWYCTEAGGQLDAATATAILKSLKYR